MVRWLLRLEGAGILAAAIALFAEVGAPWWIFPAAFLAPDLGLVGYAAGNRIGAWTYNIAHFLPFALAVAMAGHFADSDPIMVAGLVWAGHIGADRIVDYGFKYAAAPKPTHMQKV